MYPGQGLTNVRRSLLERVLDVVRELGAVNDIDEILQRIARAVVEVLEFGAAAINVANPDGEVRVEAVVGPPDAQKLLGQSSPLAYWLDVLDASEAWGSLRFFGHDRDQTLIERIASWVPDFESSDEPDSWHPEDALFAPLRDPDGALLGVISVDQPLSGRRPDLQQLTILELFAAQAAIAISDSRARQASEARRNEAELRWKLAFDNSPVGTAIIDIDGRLLQSNQALRTMLGWDHDDHAHVHFDQFTHPEDVLRDEDLFADLVAGKQDSYQVEKRYLRSDGSIMWGLLHVGAVRDPRGRLSSIIGQVNDITDRKYAEAQLAHRATHDPLTALPNRSLIEERLDAHLARGTPTGVLFFDLDRFKTVNDSLGHDAGDELLTAVTGRLAEVIPGKYTLGRVGGDEFVVLAPGESDPVALRRFGDELMRVLQQPLTVRGHQHTVSLSVGMTVSRPTHQHADEVLREADQAMLRAKRHGRGRVESYDPTQDKPATVADLELEHDLRDALATGTGLLPYFQPIITLADNTPAGYEALIRWQHPQLGLLDPDAFLPMAEKTGLIVPIGWWMLDVSCQAAMSPEFTAGRDRWVAVNASGSQLGRNQLVPLIRRALSNSGLPPHRLHLEITETALVEASQAAIEEVREVADLGVAIALDDFGTGYSSLTLLRDLPVSTVKIDRSFITPIGVDRSATAIVRRLISLCEELGVTTVAEGVESQQQLTALRALGCTEAQGYLVGAPAPLHLMTEDRRYGSGRSSA
jgi:diguanylate cyclase (GGDEF)-like protein/PAS domain S-box-containing protein